MSQINRKSWIIAAAAAVVGGAAASLVTFPVARAQDSMKAPMMADSGLKEAAMKSMDMMKAMVSEPSKMDKAKVKMAKAMLMDKMTKELAMDPDFQKATMASMEDADMKKTHDAAKMMVEDEAESKKMMEQVEKDPEAMSIIIHNAAMMTMMKDKGGMGAMMDKKMGDMKMGEMK